MNDLTISELWVYPIKSARGLAVSEWDVVDHGFKWDRQWMFVDEQNEFVTQRDRPWLATLVTSLNSERLRVEGFGASAEFSLSSLNTPVEEFEVWEQKILAQSEPLWEPMAKVFPERLRLVRACCDSRKTKPQYPLFPLTFVDSMPFLVTSEESLKDLNARAGTAFPMNRFRANIVIRGGKPYQEDHWKKFETGGIEFSFTKPCSRCVITSTDQNTGIVQKPSPLKTLSTYRRQDSKVFFGSYYGPSSYGTLRVGDSIKNAQQREGEKLT